MALAIERRLLTVEEYYRLAETGILSPDDRVELLDGEVVRMSPMKSRHAGGINRVHRWFSQRIARRAIVSVQTPVRLSPHSEPEPDVALLRLRPDLYATAHPEPADVLLLVEIAETSLTLDLGLKARLYAQSGIVELWVIDLVGDVVWVHREPGPDGYKQVVAFRRGVAVTSLAFPDVSIPVATLLGNV